MTRKELLLFRNGLEENSIKWRLTLSEKQVMLSLEDSELITNTLELNDIAISVIDQLLEKNQVRDTDLVDLSTKHLNLILKVIQLYHLIETLIS